MIDLLMKKIKVEKETKRKSMEDNENLREKEEEEELSKFSIKDNENDNQEDGDSILSDLNLEKVENPRQRELLLLAKIKLTKDTIATKNKLIESLKDALESDEQVKKTMQDKIAELKSKIDGFRDDIVKKSTRNVLHFHELQEELSDLNDQGPAVNEINMDNENILKEHRHYEYMYANTALSNEHQSRLFILKSQTFQGKFTHFLERIISLFLPFQNDMSLLAYSYDCDVQILFQIVRFLMLVSVGTMLIFAYFLIAHALSADYSTIIYCKYSIPCVLFYSRIPKAEIGTYSISYMAMTAFVLYCAIMKWINYSKLQTNSELYDRNETIFSQFIFTSWDWSYKTPALYMEKKRRLRSLYCQSMYEAELNENIKLRTPAEKCGVLTLRLLSILISLIILCVYALAILAAYLIRSVLKNQDIQKTTYTAVDIIYDIIPPILIAIWMLIFPSIFKQLVIMERWQFKSTIREQTVYRYFICNLWGLGVIYFTNIYFNILGNDLTNIISPSIYSMIGYLKISTFGCPGVYELNTNYTLLYDTSVNSIYTPVSNSIYAECPEDDSAINILFIVIAYFLLHKIWNLMAFVFLFCCSSRRKKGENYKWPFQVGHSSVEVFILIIQMYAVIPYFPYITILIPLIILIEFKFEVFKLLSLTSKPLRFNLSKRTPGYVMNLFAMSQIVLFVFNTVFFIGRIPHNNFLNCMNTQAGNVLFIGRQFCGPVASWSSMSQGFVDSINSNSFSSFIYYIISTPEPLVVILIFVICTILYRSPSVDTYKFYVQEREKDLAQSINALQSKVQMKVRSTE